MSELLRQKLIDSEENYENTTFWMVQPLFNYVKTGDTESLKKNLNIRLERFPEGRITRDARRQLEYLTVSMVNTFMIAAIEGGAYPPDANAVSDQALRTLSRSRSASDFPGIIKTAAIGLCELTAAAIKADTGNPSVEKAKQFISASLTRNITLEDIAEAAGISPYHLCRLFKKHTGKTIREYLLQKRIEAAEDLLKNSALSIPQVSGLLCFCDQSYFTAVFRRHTGQTPSRFRQAAAR